MHSFFFIQGHWMFWWKLCESYCQALTVRFWTCPPKIKKQMRDFFFIFFTKIVLIPPVEFHWFVESMFFFNFTHLNVYVFTCVQYLPLYVMCLYVACMYLFAGMCESACSLFLLFIICLSQLTFTHSNQRVFITVWGTWQDFMLCLRDSLTVHYCSLWRCCFIMLFHQMWCSVDVE